MKKTGLQTLKNLIGCIALLYYLVYSSSILYFINHDSKTLADNHVSYTLHASHGTHDVHESHVYMLILLHMTHILHIILEKGVFWVYPQNSLKISNKAMKNFLFLAFLIDVS